MKKLFALILCLMLACSAFTGALAAYEDEIIWNGVYDVIVVGFGGAGAATAITAADAGADVLLLEKAPFGGEGGNSKYAAQAILGIHDVEDAFNYFKIMRGNNTQPNDTVLRTYVEGIADVQTWFESMANEPIVKMDIDSEYPGLVKPGTLTYNFVNGEMFTSKFWTTLRRNVMERSEKIEVWYDAPGKELIQDPITGVILGVVAEVNGQRVNLRARNGVVLTTGGYEANAQMIRDYCGMDNILPLGSYYNTGDGVKMAQAVGADLWHMSNIMGPYYGIVVPGRDRIEIRSHISFTGKSKTSFGANSGILVTGTGTRFVDETESNNHGFVDYDGNWIRPVVDDVYAIFDEAARENIVFCNAWSENSQEELEKGWIIQADTIEELAEKVGLNPATLAKTVQVYNGYCETGEDLHFARPADCLIPIENGPYYAIKLTKVVVNTQGGPVRNEKGEILDTFGNPIPHLYSAGELGSINAFHYQGGGNLAECLVFGRISGEQAAMVKDNQPSENLTIEPFTYSAEAQEIVLADNEKLGVGTGIGGNLQVKVTVEGNVIKAVEVLSHHESAGVCDKAIELIPARIVEANSAEVDIVAGVTLTSNAIMQAVVDALN